MSVLSQRPAVRVMVVDDHDGMRGALGDVVAAAPGFELVAEAASGEQALVVARPTHPALVLMDVQMPGIGGLVAARQLTREASTVVVVLVSAEPDYTIDARAYGAAALLDKRHLRPGSLAALWRVHGWPGR
jgi:two-component system invasion response regulator UvrY